MGYTNRQSGGSGLQSAYDIQDVSLRSTSHAREKFLSNRNAPSLPVTGVRSLIYQSWLRSDLKGIEAEQFGAPIIESRDRVKELRYENNQLCRAARGSFAQIGKMLKDAEMMLVLTDRNGTVMETVGDRSTLERGRKINLDVGGLWSEDASGTNGIGTALWAGKPVFVHGTEHFCEGMNSWSCAAAPIRDPMDQSIIGVIDLSGLTTIFQKHNAAFAAAAAGEIFAALAHEQDAERMRLFEAVLSDLPPGGLDGEALVLVDRSGRLVYSQDLGATDYFMENGTGVRHGQRFFDISVDMSQDEISAVLPPQLECKDIRHLEFDGEVKGAAFIIPTKYSQQRRQMDPARLSEPVVLSTGWSGKIRGEIVGKSEPFLEALDVAHRIAHVNTPTLIEGETGAGKEMFARFIHSRMGPVDDNPFVSINCSAVPRELFGGDPTGERQRTEGVYGDTENQTSDISDSVNAGVLCLDKIGELSLELQPRLLRVIEERMVSGYLRQQGLSSGFRLISLSSRNLSEEVQAGRFKKDLYYRIGAMVLSVPPLRVRGEDILLIADHLNAEISDKMGADPLVLGSDIQDILMAYSWPGNVRELRNLIAQLHCLAKGRHIVKDDLPRAIVDSVEIPASSGSPDEAGQLRLGGTLALKKAEEALILQAITEHGGNLSKTAEALGISRPTLYRKMKIYAIERKGE
ncbi:sigma-54-dependent Fis family transcriptional regulator [Hoeflea sp. TYP-13]|uniref:sigma-54-dependent Fis family transcriptional regulator n=1 Tax=Hoeflea sp. TYP-13 TaxID=3230023 RepID=UPI0034C62EB6